MTNQNGGIHHIAVMATDIKTHIEFFSQVLGYPLVALFDMHGVPGALHAFLKMADHSYFSIVQMAGVGDIPATIGVTHAGRGDSPSAAGTMQHLAFAAASDADLLAMRDRIRSHGVNVIGPIDHGMCRSIYFAGPDHLTLEVATSSVPLDPAMWIDPAALAKAGISAEQAQALTAPAQYNGPSPVAQPVYDASQPHLAYPKDIYLKMLALPDDVITARSSYAEPPVKVSS